MPTYQYVCEECGEEFEQHVSFRDDPDAILCPRGHKRVRRIFTPPGIVFKGKGFYITDNRSASKSSGSEN